MGSYKKPPAKRVLPDGDTFTPRSHKDALEQIADLMGFPVEAFTNGVEIPTEVGGAVELLEIWDGLSTDEDREKLLKLVRNFRKA